MSDNSSAPESASDLQQTVISGLQALPLSTLIGGPLDACIQAQAQSAQSTLDFIHQAGFTRESGQWKVVNLTFTYQKGAEKVQLVVPLLTVVPIPYIGIDKIDIAFQANISAVSSQVYTESDSSELDGSIQSAPPAEADSQRLIQPEFKANYSRHSNKESQSGSRYASEYNLDIKLSASQASMPAGLQSILNILQEGVSQEPAPPEMTVTPFSNTLAKNQVRVPVAYTATLTDSAGRTLSGERVVFELEPPLDATLHLVMDGIASTGLSMSGATNSDGQVILRVLMTRAQYTEDQTLKLRVIAGSQTFAAAELQLTVPPAPPTPVATVLSFDPAEMPMAAPQDSGTASVSSVIQVTDADGQGIPAESVNVTLTPPLGDAVLNWTLGGEDQSGFGASGITDDQGQLTVAITSDQIFYDSETLTLTATAGELEAIAAVELTGAPAPMPVAAGLSFDQSAKALKADETGNVAVVFILQVVDDTGRGMADQAIQISLGDVVPAGDAQLTLSLGDVVQRGLSGSGTTDEQGQLTVTVTAENTFYDDGRVGITADGPEGLEATAAVALIGAEEPPPPAPIVFAVTLNEPEEKLRSPQDANFPKYVEWTATVTDSSGNPLAGQNVQVDVDPPQGDAQLSLRLAGQDQQTLSATATTDASGQLYIRVTAESPFEETESLMISVTANEGADAVQAKATLDLLGLPTMTTDPAGGTVTFDEGSPETSTQQFSANLTNISPDLDTYEVVFQIQGCTGVGWSFEILDGTDAQKTSDSETQITVVASSSGLARIAVTMDSLESGQQTTGAMEIVLNHYDLTGSVGLVCQSTPQACDLDLTPAEAQTLSGDAVGSTLSYTATLKDNDGAPMSGETLHVTLSMTDPDYNRVLMSAQSEAYTVGGPIHNVVDIHFSLGVEAGSPTSMITVDGVTNEQGVLEINLQQDENDADRDCPFELMAACAEDATVSSVVTLQVTAPTQLPSFSVNPDAFAGDGALVVQSDYTPEVLVLAAELRHMSAITVQLRAGLVDDGDGSGSVYFDPFGAYQQDTSDIRQQVDIEQRVNASMSATYALGVYAQTLDNNATACYKALNGALIITDGYDASLLDQYDRASPERTPSEIISPYVNTATGLVSLASNQIILIYELTGDPDPQVVSSTGDMNDAVLLVTFNPSEPASCNLEALGAFDSNNLPSSVDVTATVLDADGNPFIGQPVDFSKTYTVELQVGQSSSSVTTDGQGAAAVTITLITADITTEDEVQVIAAYPNTDTVAAEIDLPVEPPEVAPEPMTYTVDNTQYNGDGAFLPGQSYQPEVMIIYSETGSSEVTARFVVAGDNYDIFGDYENPANDIRLKNTDYLFPQTFAANTPFGICAQEWSGSNPKKPQTLSNAMVLRDGDDATNIPSEGHDLKGHLTDYIVDGKISLASNQAIVAFEIGDGSNDHTVPTSGDFADAVFLVTFNPLTLALDFDAAAYDGDGGLVCNNDADVNITLLAAENSDPVSCWFKMGETTYWLFDCHDSSNSDDDYTRLQIPQSEVVPDYSAGEYFGIYAKAWQGSTAKNECCLSSALILWHGDDAGSLPATNNGGQQNLADILSSYGYVDNGKIKLEDNQVIVAFELGVASTDSNSPAQTPPASGDYQDAAFLITFDSVN